MKDKQLPVMRAFWHGAPLGKIESLSLKSFVAQGHDVELYTYSDLEVPTGVKVLDANTIIPEKKIFRYEGRPQYANRGSLAGFADWFRYEMLYQHGGVWFDLDMVALKPLDINKEYIFGFEDPGVINIAILGLPQGSKLAYWMADLCKNPNKIKPYDTVMRVREKLKRFIFEGNKRGNVQFGEYGPRGFSLACEHFNLAHHALNTETFYPVHYTDWKDIFTPGALSLENLPQKSFAIHLWNEKLRQDPEFDKEAIPVPHSLYYQISQNYFEAYP